MTFLACVAVSVLAVVMPQNPNVRVHDFAGLLSADQRTAVEQVTEDVEKQTTAQLAVVTVKSLDGKTVEVYANELFNAWGIGQKDVNNGVLLLVAPQQRRMRIEVGRGVELLLTDALCGQIRDTFIIPRFKQGDFAGGIVAGTEELARVLKSDPEAARGLPNSGPALARAAHAQCADGDGRGWNRGSHADCVWIHLCRATPLFDDRIHCGDGGRFDRGGDCGLADVSRRNCISRWRCLAERLRLRSVLGAST